MSNPVSLLLRTLVIDTIRFLKFVYSTIVSSFIWIFRLPARMVLGIIFWIVKKTNQFRNWLNKKYKNYVCRNYICISFGYEQEKLRSEIQMYVEENFSSPWYSIETGSYLCDLNLYFSSMDDYLVFQLRWKGEIRLEEEVLIHKDYPRILTK